MILDEAHAYFRVTEFGDDPDVVTRLVGVAPTTAWVKAKGHGAHHGLWELASSLDGAAAPASHVAELVETLAKHANGVRKAADRYQAGIWCAVYYEDATPSIPLGPELLRTLAELGLGLTLDLYFVGGEAEKPRPPAEPEDF